MKNTCIVCLVVFVTLGGAFAGKPLPATLVGQWDFDASQNLTAATLGNDLTLTGQDTAVTGYDVSDGAARIGIGSYYVCDHGIAPNGGGSYVNEWSLVMDVSFPTSSSGLYKCLYQTNINNSNDGDCFIRPSGGVGITATGYSDASAPIFSAQAETWYRIVIVVDNGKIYDIYVNGTKYLDGNSQGIDGTFSLDPQMLFFADDNGEDYPIDVSTILLYNGVLKEEEIVDLKGPGGQDPPVADIVLTQPYLQSVHTTGITVMWEMSDTAPCTLEYGPDTNYGSTSTITSSNSSGGTKIYKSAISGLDPATTYHFRVNVDGITGDDRTFTTAPVNNADFSFAVWSDSQGVSAATIPIMQHMAASGVDFGVACGDMCEDGGSYSSVRSFFLDRVAKYFGQTVPFDIAWGNHDNYGGAIIKEFTDFGSGNYSFDYAGCHFVCVDYTDMTDYNWIANDLASAGSARHIFLFIHVPPYCELWIDGDAGLRANLVPLLEQYDVDVCFSGHTHEYERGFLNDVYYCIASGASWLDYGEPLVYDWPHMTVGGYHDLGSGIDSGLVNEYTRVDVTSTGWTATMVAFNPDGSLLPQVSDTFSKATGQPDTTPPTPDPMTFATVPHATGSTSISMTATTATDPSGIEYYFTCTAGGGNDSGWQASPVYEDTGLTPDTQYTYTVKATDLSANFNETAPSGPSSATTDATGGVPGQASNPSPSDGQQKVSKSGVTLSWTAGSGADSHNVYFGTDSTPDSTEFVGNQTGTTFNTGSLSGKTWYYWRIDEVNSSGTTTGVVWSFKTK